jgi:hypothetical protein
MQTIITLPQPIQRAIATLLADAGSNAWMKRAQLLHQRYRQQEENKQQIHVVDALDALAYLGLRASATAKSGGRWTPSVTLCQAGSPQPCSISVVAPVVVSGR